MKRFILFTAIFCGILSNMDGKQSVYWWYAWNFDIGTFSKVEMPDENHMQFEISFEDSDFTLKRRINETVYDSIFYKGNQPYKARNKYGDSCGHSWEVNFTRPDIPTSAFHLLLPADREVDTVEYDTIGKHLFATNVFPNLNTIEDVFPIGARILETESASINSEESQSNWEYITSVIEDRGSNNRSPFRFEAFVYLPCLYDSVSKNLWIMKKISIKITLKPVERLTVKNWDPLLFRDLCLYSKRPVINPEDGAKFYPEYTGIETLGAGKESYLRIRSKNELEGSVSETTQKAYIEIRNGLGQHVRSVAVSERGKFSINLGSENVSPGFYLCTLVADGKRIDTTKIIVEP
jgi:hypothetical protein